MDDDGKKPEDEAAEPARDAAQEEGAKLRKVPGEVPGDQATPALSRDHLELASDADEFATHSVEYWNRASHEERKSYYVQIEKFYKKILDEFFQQANASADQYLTYSRRHLATRRRMIILGGGLALLNVFIAYTASKAGFGSSEAKDTWTSLLVTLPLFAALYATSLAIYSSLENLYGYAGRAQRFREVRELFLNSARDYEMLWNVNVRPFGYTAPACINASIAYRRIVRKDNEVRSQAKELVERTSEKEQPSGAG